MTKVGIDLISFATSDYYLSMDVYAKNKSIDYAKFSIGLGQKKMSIPPPDEDIVTLATKATIPILQQIDGNEITAVLFATESGIDQSKSAGSFLHGLLNLSNNCRIIELKHACYAGVAALQMATTMVKADNSEKILVIASDIAKYDLNSSGEPTQGCGAVAMLIKSKPRILSIEAGSGYYTEDVMDFWRPNYRSTALVDGKYSTKIYIKSLKKTWQNFHEKTNKSFQDIDYFCYHSPFTKMAEKAHKVLTRITNTDLISENFNSQIEHNKEYNSIIGNSYCSSVFISFCSLIDNTQNNLIDKRIAFFSYGSGSVAEFFTGIIQPDYKQYIMSEHHKHNLSKRKSLSYEQYLNFHKQMNLSANNTEYPTYNQGIYRLNGIKEHKRIYIKKSENNTL